MSPLMEVPSEVLLFILSNFLEISEVLSMRQTCRGISQVTRDKSLWLSFLVRLRDRGDIPLPPTAHGPGVVDLAAPVLESIVVSATHAADSWLRPRTLVPILNQQHSDPIHGMNIFLDSWLLIVHQDGLVHLWDIREQRDGLQQRGCCATLNKRAPGVWWRSYEALLIPGSTQILLALSSTSGEASVLFETVLYQIDIGTSDFYKEFNLLRAYPYSIPRTIRAIDPGSRLLILSSSMYTMDIICWDDALENSATIVMDDDDAEDLYNDILALRYFGSHFLVVRIHSIELHVCGNTRSKPRTRPLKHRLPFPLIERTVSVSEPTTISSDTSERRITMNALAYDVHSLACYFICIVLPDATVTDVHPAMDVTLIGEARPVSPPGQPGNPLARSRWFVSGHALGPQAIRAMWIERGSVKMARHIRLCSLNRHSAWHDMNTAMNAFVLSSYDLREDLTHCALAELSGRIALANRSGHVFLLEPVRGLVPHADP